MVLSQTISSKQIFPDSLSWNINDIFLSNFEFYLNAPEFYNFCS